jgi:hypothetical protein
MIPANVFANLTQLQTLFVLCTCICVYVCVYVCACGCLCVRDCACVCMSVYECIVRRCGDRLMSCRRLDYNSITMIPANAFTNLLRLQALFDVSLSPLSECRTVEDNPLTTIASAAFDQDFDGSFRFLAL